MRQTLDERRNLIEQRARTLLTRRFGGRRRDRGHSVCGPPIEPHAPAGIRPRSNVAAYRDGYSVEDRTLLGPKPATDSQSLDRARALASTRRAEPEAAPAARNDPVAAMRL
ncbi:hypothetical protein GCM10027596_24590 [Nocardioides korecus]